jgi:hypothetical protein
MEGGSSIKVGNFDEFSMQIRNLSKIYGSKDNGHYALKGERRKIASFLS